MAETNNGQLETNGTKVANPPVKKTGAQTKWGGAEVCPRYEFVQVKWLKIGLIPWCYEDLPNPRFIELTLD